MNAGCHDAFEDSVDMANAGVLKKGTEYLGMSASWSLLPFNIKAVIQPSPDRGQNRLTYTKAPAKQQIKLGIEDGELKPFAPSWQKFVDDSTDCTGEILDAHFATG